MPLYRIFPWHLYRSVPLFTNLDYGVLRSESHRAPVAFSVPMKSLRYLFPRLWPEAEADFE